MSITTLDGVLAGMQAPSEFVKAVTGNLYPGRPHSLFYLSGIPGPAVAPTPGLKGAALTAYLGQLPFTNPLSGNSYLARFAAQATQAGMLLLCDRLWHNSGFDITSNAAQIVGNTITSSSVANPTVITCSSNHPFANGDVVNIANHAGSTPAISGSYTISNCNANSFTIPVNVSVGGAGGSVGLALPARDASGSINGESVYLGVEVSTTTGAGTPNLTAAYTNSAGVNLRTGTNVATFTTSIAGAFYPIGLAAGDTGVRSIQSLTLSATWTSGVIHLVAYRVLARLPLQANIPNALDALTAGFPRLFDDSVPFLIFVPSATTSSNILGHAIWTQG